MRRVFLRQLIVTLVCTIALVNQALANGNVKQTGNLDQLFVEEKGQNFNPDVLKFTWSGNQLFAYFCTDRVVFATQEVRYVENEESKAAREKGDINKALKLSAQTSSRFFALEFKEANSSVKVVGDDLQKAVHDFYLAHCSEGIRNAKTYKKIKYNDIYPNIDLEFYIEGAKIKYNFIVRAGGNVADIQLGWHGVENLQLTENGVQFSVGEFDFTDQLPISFCEGKQLATNYVVKENVVGFEVEEYDRSKEMMVDPGIVWTSHLEYNGYGTWGEVVHDRKGNYFYVVDCEWNPTSPDFANYLTFSHTNTNYISSSAGHRYDIIISKFSTDGIFNWSCRYGGEEEDDVNGGVIYDPYNDRLYVTGMTSSSNIPLYNRSGAFNLTWQTAYHSTCTRGYMLMFDGNSNDRLWATLLDNGYKLEVFDMAVKPDGDVYLVGQQSSSVIPRDITNYPTIFNYMPCGTGYCRRYEGAPSETTSMSLSFIMRFSREGTLKWSTFLPKQSYTPTVYSGTVSDIEVDNDGNIYLVGDDIWEEGYRFSTSLISSVYTHAGNGDLFRMKFNSSNQPVPQWGGYFGGAGWDKINIGSSNGDIELDEDGNLYISGHTTSANFPVRQISGNSCAYFNNTICGPVYNDPEVVSNYNTSGNQHGYFTRIKTNADGTSSIDYSTFLGGKSSNIRKIQKDDDGSLWICGTTSSPTMTNIEVEGYYNGASTGTSEAFFAQMSPSNELVWLAYYGPNTGYSGFDIFDEGIMVNLYWAGQSGNHTNVGVNYQYNTTSSSFTRAMVIENKAVTGVTPRVTPAAAIDCRVNSITADVAATTPSYMFHWYLNACEGEEGSTEITGSAITGEHHETLDISTYPAGTVIYVKATGGCFVNECVEYVVPGLEVEISGYTAAGCAGTEHTLDAGAGYDSYEWRIQGETAVIGSTRTINVHPDATTTYEVTVRDGSGCSATATQTVEVKRVSFNSTPHAVTTCATATNGSINITDILGTAPFRIEVFVQGTETALNTYNNINANAHEITGLAAGTYTIKITDNDGCSGTQDVTILGTTNTYSVSITPETAVIDCSGSLLTLSTNETGDTYSWSGGLGTNSAANVSAPGTYSVTVTKDGCTASASRIVSRKQLEAGFAATGISCAGLSDGKITVTVSEGAAPYTLYVTSGGTTTNYTFSSSTKEITGLAAGNYSLRLTEANGCERTENVTVGTSDISANVTIQSTNTVVCEGETAELSVTGTATSYHWNTGSTDPTIVVTTSGTYTVTVINGSCTATSEPFVLTITPQPTITPATGSGNTTQSICEGNNIQPIIFNLGNANSYSFEPSLPDGMSVNFVAETSVLTISGRPSTTGNFTFNVRPANTECSTTSPNTISCSITLNSAPTLDVSVNAASEICHYETAQITVTPAGGTEPYQYAWTGHTSFANAVTDLAPGNYTITVKDANGCTATDNLTVSDFNNPEDWIIKEVSASNPNCFGDGGTVDITIIASTPNYTYILYNGETPAYSFGPTDDTQYQFTGVAPGTYTVAVRDNNGCERTHATPITIGEAPAQLQVSAEGFSTTNKVCETLGSVEFQITGGTGAYNFTLERDGAAYTIANISVSGSTARATGLEAGTYTVTLLDGNECSQELLSTFTISDNNSMTISQSGSSTNVACIGESTGSFVVEVQNGTPNYTFTILKDGVVMTNPTTSLAGNVLTVSNLAAGSYSVRVNDANGCSAETATTITISQPAEALTATIEIDPAERCHDAEFGLTVYPIGGSGEGTYTYAWNDGNTNQSRLHLTNYTTYTVIVRDAGCEFTTSITPTNAAELVFTATPTFSQPECSGETGSINISISGGHADYTYNVLNGTTTAYTFGPTSETSHTFDNIASGNYTVQVLDRLGCEVRTTTTINISDAPQPIQLVAGSLQVTNKVCATPGSASFEITGGTAPYSYSIMLGTEEIANDTNISAETEISVGNLGIGDYTIHITDANNCNNGETGISFQIIDEGNLQISQTGTIGTVQCFGAATGSFQVTVTNGDAPYNYTVYRNGTSYSTITDADPNFTFTGLEAGSYYVHVSDANSCSDQTEGTVTISQPAVELSAEASTSQIACNDDKYTISAEGEGGNAPYSYAWSNGITEQSQTGLETRDITYTVTVRDANGCSATASTSPAYPEAGQLSANPFAVPILCFGGTTTISADAQGGWGSYTYIWDNNPALNQATLPNATATEHSVQVTDEHGCVVTSANFTPTQPAAAVSLVAPVTVTNKVCATPGSASFEITGGTAPYSYSIMLGTEEIANDTNISAETEISVDNLGIGDYTIHITDANNCNNGETGIPFQIIDEGNLQISQTGTIGTVQCFGAATGSFQVTVTNGDAPYNYTVYRNGTSYSTITDADPNFTFTGLEAGSYYVHVSDANSCSDQTEGTVTISQPAVELSAEASTSQIACNDDKYTISAEGEGGNAPYSYAWSNGITEQSQAGLETRDITYTVTVRDANGCSATASTSPVYPEAGQLSANPSAEPILCFGGTTTISADAQGGWGSYTYIWDNNPELNQATLPNATATEHSVQVTDEHGCVVTSANFTPTQPAAAVSLVAPVTVTNKVCATPGSASFEITGGTAPYSYSIMLGTEEIAVESNISAETEISVDNLGIGVYTIIITDANSCNEPTNSTFEIIDEGNLQISQTGTIGTVQCFGAATGSLQATVTNGVAPYNYTVVYNGTPQTPISSNEATYTFNNLAAGSYDVRVVDGNQCSAVTTSHIEVPSLAEIVPHAEINSVVRCFDEPSDLHVTATGGTAPYQYRWTNTSETYYDLSHVEALVPGNYTITVKDANGCTAATTASIQNPPQGQLLANPSAEPIACFGGTTTISANAQGGWGNYTYIWDNNPALNQATLPNATATPHTVQVTDDHGCVIVSASYTPIQPETAVDVVNLNVQDRICEAAGSVNFQISGGNAPYSYLVKFGDVQVANGNNISSGQPVTVGNLQETGSYTIIITDNTGCNEPTNTTFQIGESGNLQLSLIDNSLVNVGCRAESTGAFSVEIVGGTAPYNYTITRDGIEIPANTISVNGNTLNATNLTSGSYLVTVADRNNCSAQTATPINIAQPAESLTATASLIAPVICNNDSFSLQVIATGGTPNQGGGYSYRWDNGATSATQAGLTNFATYNVTVTDANECTAAASVTPANPPQLIVNEIITNAQCFGRNGSVELQIFGGTPEYTVTWDGGITGNVNSSITPETVVNYTVTDNAGCTITGDVTVSQPQSINFTLDMQPISCYGNADGAISVQNLTGGTGLYNYIWSNGVTGQTIIQNLQAGNYSLVVTDSNGCNATQSVILNQPDRLLATVSYTNIECGQTQGSATVEATGGNGDYTYQWSNSVFGTTIDNLREGTYSVIVRDNLGCSASAAVQININGVLNVAVTLEQAISCFGANDAVLSATAENAQEPTSYIWTGDLQGRVQYNLAPGYYAVNVEDAWGCKGLATQIIPTPTAINVTTNITNAKCFDSNDGKIIASVSGGYPPYNYAWSNGGNNSIIENLYAGRYTLVITDSTNCQFVQEYSVSAPAKLEIDLDVTNIDCYGNKNGGVTINANGGVQPYDYAFSTGNSVVHGTNVYSRLRKGNYTITVTDKNNCSETQAFSILEPPQLTATAEVNSPSCKHLNDASITIQANGGTGNYLYLWNNYTSDSATFSRLRSGIYNIVVTDENNCSVEVAEITIPNSKEDCIRIPNVFTPNGDGINDEWIIEHIDRFPEAHIYIFNRWGQMLYQGQGIDEPWNGEYKGKFVPAGTYLYVIDLHSVEETYEGTVTVLY